MTDFSRRNALVIVPYNENELSHCRDYYNRSLRIALSHTRYNAFTLPDALLLGIEFYADLQFEGEGVALEVLLDSITEEISAINGIEFDNEKDLYILSTIVTDLLEFIYGPLHQSLRRQLGKGLVPVKVFMKRRSLSILLEEPEYDG